VESWKVGKEKLKSKSESKSKSKTNGNGCTRWAPNRRKPLLLGFKVWDTSQTNGSGSIDYLKGISKR